MTQNCLQEQRLQLVAWAQELREFTVLRNETQIPQEIDAAIGQLRDERFVLAVLGKAKRGKSTLLNALLGRHDDLIAPVDRLPASSAISRVSWGAAEHAVVLFRDGHKETISLPRIREFVTEEENPENHKAVSAVEIAAPFEGLDHDIVLVDTPGAGSLHEYHDALLHAFIPQSDAVIFLVSARMPLDQDEIDLLKALRAADVRKVFFAINRVDESTADDISAAEAHNRKLLADVGIAVTTVHRISGKQAFLGQLASSGVPEFLSDIQEFMAANKGQYLAARFVARVRVLIEPCLQGLEIEVASASRTADELRKDLSQLLNQKQSLNANRSLDEREFRLNWNRSLEAFRQTLAPTNRDLIQELHRQIADSSLMGITKLRKNLPTWIVKELETRLAPASKALEGALRDACGRLEASYPVLSIGQGGNVALRAQDSSAALVGAVGGAAVSAAGVGFAMAGASAATSIATANAAVLAAAVPAQLAAGAGAVLSYVPYVGGFLSNVLGAVGSGAAGTTLMATPAWVVLSGPAGWTLAGIGALIVPITWRSSKLKQKANLQDAAEDQIDQLFRAIETEQIGALQRMSESILEEFAIRLERQLSAAETAITRACDHRPDEPALAQLRATLLSIRDRVQHAPGEIARDDSGKS